MREWKVPLQIFATRHAEASDRAKHGWADAAEKETEYLWPISAMKVLWLVLTGRKPTYVRLVEERHARGDFSEDL